MSVPDEEIRPKVLQWLAYGGEDLRLRAAESSVMATGGNPQSQQASSNLETHALTALWDMASPEGPCCFLGTSAMAPARLLDVLPWREARCSHNDEMMLTSI